MEFFSSKNTVATELTKVYRDLKNESKSYGKDLTITGIRVQKPVDVIYWLASKKTSGTTFPGYDLDGYTRQRKVSLIPGDKLLAAVPKLSYWTKWGARNRKMSEQELVNGPVQAPWLYNPDRMTTTKNKPAFIFDQQSNSWAILGQRSWDDLVSSSELNITQIESIIEDKNQAVKNVQLDLDSKRRTLESETVMLPLLEELQKIAPDWYDKSRLRTIPVTTPSKNPVYDLYYNVSSDKFGNLPRLELYISVSWESVFRSYVSVSSGNYESTDSINYSKWLNLFSQGTKIVELVNNKYSKKYSDLVNSEEYKSLNKLIK